MLSTLLNWFRQEKRVFRTIKLYSIAESQDGLNRAALVEALLKMCEKNFGNYPRKYDIHGPYGVRKGSTVGLSAFKKKLEKIGHEKYYALSAETEDLFGFQLLLSAKFDACTYSELIIWYSDEIAQIEFMNIVQPIQKVFNITSGYSIDIKGNYNLSTETENRQGVFGTSVKISYEHKKWLNLAHRGKVRDLFMQNILNEAQTSKLKQIGVVSEKKFGDLTFVEFNCEHELAELRKRLLEISYHT